MRDRKHYEAALSFTAATLSNSHSSEFETGNGLILEMLNLMNATPEFESQFIQKVAPLLARVTLLSNARFLKFVEDWETAGRKVSAAKIVARSLSECTGLI